ncbi:MAG: hypothetical protein ACR2M0_11625 [Chloroflexia bacterium]
MNSPILSLVRRVAILATLPVLLLAGGCSGTPTDTPPPEPTVAGGAAPALTSVSTSAPAATGTRGSAGVHQAYEHTADYSVIAGKVSHDGSCVVVTYVSPLVLVAVDKYNNHFALLPGNWDAASVKDGAWVVLHGRPADPGIAVPGCSLPGYIVSALDPNPNAP